MEPGRRSASSRWYRTLDDVPEPPVPPTEVAHGNCFAGVQWREPRANGAPIECWEGEIFSEAHRAWYCLFAALADTEYNIGGLAPASVYSVRVRCCNPVGWSEWSTSRYAQPDEIAAALVRHKQGQAAAALGARAKIVADAKKKAADEGYGGAEADEYVAAAVAAAAAAEAENIAKQHAAQGAAAAAGAAEAADDEDSSESRELAAVAGDRAAVGRAAGGGGEVVDAEARGAGVGGSDERGRRQRGGQRPEAHPTRRGDGVERTRRLHQHVCNTVIQ